MKYKNNIEFVNEYLESSEWLLTLATLWKQSRKKGSFHSISEAGASPMRFRDWPASWWTRLSIQRFSKSHLLVLVPPFHFHDNFSMKLNVLRRWFALLHLLRNASQAQVVPGADGPENVAKPQNQQVLESPFCCRLSPVSVLFRIWLVSISATGV